MKHAAILMMVLIAISAFGEGRAEKTAAKPIEIVFLHTPTTQLPPNSGYKGPLIGNDFNTAFLSLFVRDHPEVTIRHVNIDLSTGAAMTMDALVASGQAPDVYHDAPMRTAKYCVPEYALALDGYIKDLDDYFPSALDGVRRGGKVYGLPAGGWLTSLCVNTDLVARAGADIPLSWNIDDFLAMARKVRALNDGSYATYLFAGNQSSDQWWMPWFTSFGARYYAVGDYSRNTLNSPQAVKALKFLKSLIDEGYVAKGAASLTDTEALTAFKQGKVAVGSMQVTHANGVTFTRKFVEFPREPGVAPVGVAAGFSAAIVKASKDEYRNQVAAQVAWHFTNANAQTMALYSLAAQYPCRKSVTEKGNLNELDQQLFGLSARNGVLDMGISMPKFTPIRAMMFPLLQAFYTGKMSAEDVMRTYEANVNKELASK